MFEKLQTLWEDFVARMKALGRDTESEEVKMMEELKNRLVRIDDVLDNFIADGVKHFQYLKAEVEAALAKLEASHAAAPLPAAVIRPIELQNQLADPAAAKIEDPAKVDITAEHVADPVPVADLSANSPRHA